MSNEEIGKYIKGMLILSSKLPCDLNFDMNEEDVVYASTSLIALFFFTEIDNILFKDEKGKKTKYISKIMDIKLESALERIATKVDNRYKIGEYSCENALIMIADIRNHFAHGNYNIDVKNHLVLMDMKNTQISIEIDKLIEFVFYMLNTIYNYPKSNKLEKIYTVPDRYNECTTSEILENIRTDLYTITKNNGNYTYVELQTIEHLFEEIKKEFPDPTKKEAHQNLMKYCRKNKMKCNHESKKSTYRQRKKLYGSEILNPIVNGKLPEAYIPNTLMSIHEIITFSNIDLHIIRTGIYDMLEITKYMMINNNYSLYDVLNAKDFPKTIRYAGIDLQITNLLAIFNTLYIYIN